MISLHALFKKFAVCVAVFILSCAGACAPAPVTEKTAPLPSHESSAAPQNRLPVIHNLAADTKVIVHSTSEIVCSAEDPDGDTLSFTWSATDGTIEGKNSTVTWTAPGVPGTCTVTVTVRDENGGEVTDSVSIAVTGTPNRPPVIESFNILVHQPHAELTIDPDTPIIERQNPLVKVSRLVDIECIASDPDGDNLVFEWDIPSGKLIGHGEKVQWLASTEPQRYIIIVTVTDENGGQDTAKLAIDVECCI
jgi:hypothetical protein